MTDTNAVREIVKSKGLKYSYIAQKLGISYYTLQMKLNNRSEFTTTQVTSLCEILEVKSLTRRQELFFKEKVYK